MKKKGHLRGYGRFIAIMFLTETLILSGCGKRTETGYQIGDYRVSLTVSPDPPAVGLNTFRVRVDDASGQPVDNAVVRLHFSMPAMAGMPAMAHEATAQSQGGGQYKAEIDLTSGGKFPWDIRVEVVQGETILAVGQWQVTPGTKGIKFVSGEAPSAGTGYPIGEYRVSLTVSPDPPAVALNRFRVEVDDASGQPVDNAVVRLYFSMPAMAGMPAMAHEATAESVGSGQYKAEIDLASGGRMSWDIRLEVVQDQTILAVGQWQVTPGTKGIKFISGEAPAESSGQIDMDLVPVYEEVPAQKTEAKERKVPTVSVPLYQQQLIGVQRDTVALRSVAKTIRTVGHVAYNETKVAAVNLKFSGWIETLHVDYTGQFVKKGQPLFDIYSPELVSTQEEYLQVLRETSRLISLASMDQEASGRRNERQNSMLKSVRERLLLWGISEEQIREIENARAARMTLSFNSPITGYVVEKNTLQGRYARQGTDLYTLADLSTVWVHADIYEYELPFIGVGQTARIRLAYIPGADFVGKVDYIYPVLEPRTRTAKVRLVFPNPQLELKPDMYVDVHIDADLGRQLTISETAVLNTGTRQVVFVDRGNGRFEPREITLGTKVDRRWVVLEGLEQGEIVVKSGNFLIDAEAHVQGVLQTM